MRTWEELKDTIYDITMFLLIVFIVLFITSGITTLICFVYSMFGYAWISFIVIVFSSFMIYYLNKVTDLLDIGVFK